MSDQITYDNKVDLQVATNIANINKVTASDMNEIKSVVNGNATATETELTRLETDKLNIADVLNQASTDTDKPYSADYLNDKLVSVGTEAPTDGERVWFGKSKNILPQNKYIATTTINGITYTNNGDGTFNLNGTATANTTIQIIPEYIINMEAGKNYYLYCSEPYNSNTFNFSIVITVGSSTRYLLANNTLTLSQTPTNEKLQFYIANGLSVAKNNIKVMLVEGNTAPSVYEPYVEPSINVDEEEWYNPNNIEKYSTKEIKIGTWIDGKPLYRKVVDIGTLPNATTKHVAHNISNIGSVVTLRGIVTDYRFFPVPFAATSGAYTISIFADTTNIEVMAGNDRSNMTGFVIIEYTKTTD